MRAFVTGGTGFIGGARGRSGCATAATTSSRSPARPRRRPSWTRELVRGRPLRRRRDPPRRGGLPTPSSTSRADLQGRASPKSKREPMRDAEHRAAPSACSTRPTRPASDRIVYVSTDQHLREHERASRSTRATGATRPTASCPLRRDQVPRAPGRRGADRARAAPIVIVQPGGVYGPGDHSSRQHDRPGEHGQAAG